MKEGLRNSVNSSLKDLGIMQNQFQIIHSGRNSLSWKIKSEKATYFLKKYINKPGDIRDRLATEKGFLNLLESKNIENIPKIICFSRKYNWIILSWIKGNPIRNPNYQDWGDLLDFLASIQQIQKKDIQFLRQLILLGIKKELIAPYCKNVFNCFLRVDFGNY